MSGKLTAEQVMAIAGKHQPDYCSDTHVCFDWQAIADELNAALGNNSSRWFELFGTPERAARTITRMQMATDLMGCCDADTCPAAFEECWKQTSCPMDGYDALLEWLKEDS